MGFETMAASFEEESRCQYCRRRQSNSWISAPGSPSSTEECARALRGKFVPGPKEFFADGAAIKSQQLAQYAMLHIISEEVI